MGAGSDYVAFTHHAGIAGANIGFSGPGGGVYHSLYDTFSWYTRFADKDFLYCKALANVSSSALMRMAGAQVVPFEYGRMVRTLQSYLRELETAAGVNSGKLQLGFAISEVRRLDSSARRFEESLQRLRTMLGLSSDQLIMEEIKQLPSQQRAAVCLSLMDQNGNDLFSILLEAEAVTWT